MNEKEVRFTNKLEQIKKRCDEIMEDFSDYTDGLRFVMLMQRSKDGGHQNKEDRRIFESYITTNSEDFKTKLFNLLLIKASNSEPTRIYLSANARNVKKCIRYIQEQLLDAVYADDEQRDSLHKKLLRSPRHFVMQPKAQETSLFLIDVDDETGKDIMGEALTEMDRLGVVELKRYKTKNGWHFIVKPFNSTLWTSNGEVKKDPMILLEY